MTQKTGPNYKRCVRMELKLKLAIMHYEQNTFKKNKNVSFSKTLQNSLFLAKHTLALPLYYEMKVSEQNYVIKSLKKYI